jgi:hypothetical protein
MPQKILMILLTFIFSGIMGYSQKVVASTNNDSLIVLHGIQLTAAVNDELIESMKSGIGYSMGFTDPDTASHKAYNLIIFSPAAYGKKFFQRGAIYDIYAARYDGSEAIVPLDVFYPSPLLPLLAKRIVPGH